MAYKIAVDAGQPGERTGKIYRTALYIRLSQEDGDKEESDSIANQRKLLEGFCREREDLQICESYVDDGYTGTDFERPAFLRMMRDLKAGRADCVAVKDLSRFGRNYIDTGRYLERIFPGMGVRFIAVTDGIDSVGKEYNMLLPIKNIFNEQYARDISRKVHAAVEAKQRAGEFVGAFACYGYQKSQEDHGRLVIDSAAAQVVRRIYRLFLDGCGKREIAGILNREGIPSPAQYKALKGERYAGRGGEQGWTYSSVHKILGRETYCGSLVQGTKKRYLRGKQKAVPREEWIVVEDTQEPVIDREVWQEAQKRQKGAAGGRTCQKSGRRSVFAGFLCCGDCGAALVRQSYKKKNGEEEVSYACGTYRRMGKGYCTPHRIREKVLEDLIWEEFWNLEKGCKEREEILRRCAGGSGGRESGEEKAIRQRLERTEKKKKFCYEDYREGLLDRKDFLEYREGYEKQERFLMEQLRNLRERGEEKERITEEDWAKKFLAGERFCSLEEGILQAMVEKITVYDPKKIAIVYKMKAGTAADKKMLQSPGSTVNQ